MWHTKFSLKDNVLTLLLTALLSRKYVHIEHRGIWSWRVLTQNMAKERKNNNMLVSIQSPIAFKRLSIIQQLTWDKRTILYKSICFHKVEFVIFRVSPIGYSLTQMALGKALSMMPFLVAPLLQATSTMTSSQSPWRTCSEQHPLCYKFSMWS